MTPSVAIFDDRIEFMNPGAFPIGTTPDEFRRRPHSLPINEKIAGALFKGGKAEGWGRGILNMFTYCKEAGLPEPEYDFVTHFVCLTIRFKKPLTPYLTSEGGNDGRNEGLNEGVNEGVNEALSDLSPTVRATYSLIKKYPGLNTPQLASKCGKGDSTIERHIAILRKKDLVEHRGPDRTGGYYAK